MDNDLSSIGSNKSSEIESSQGDLYNPALPKSINLKNEHIALPDLSLNPNQTS